METELISVEGIAAALGVKLAYDVCGPTAKYLGGKTCDLAKEGISNIKRVFKSAQQKLKSSRTSDGQVSPRVLRHVIPEAFFTDDELAAEYLGGVLASSKSGISSDDRAVPYLALVSQLSTYQLRTHCIAYTSILNSKKIDDRHIQNWFLNYDVTIILDECDYYNAMSLADSESPHVFADHAFIGLEANALLSGGKEGCITDKKRKPVQNIRYFYPSRQGIELFLWAHGVGKHGVQSYFQKEIMEQVTKLFDIIPVDIECGKIHFSH